MQKRVLDPLELVIEGCHVVQGLEPRSFGRPVSSLTIEPQSALTLEEGELIPRAYQSEIFEQGKH